MVAMSKSLKTSLDRFSSLPDHVAHRILSSLSMEDISRLCLVSKKWRELCISIPILHFNDLQYRNNENKQAQLMSYIDRFWLLRQGMDTQSCYVRWFLRSSPFDEEEEQSHILSWMENSVRCNVELLNVEIILEKNAEFPLPPNILRSKSLKYLRIHLNNGILKFPSSLTAFGFSSLQFLSLNSVQIDESLGEWISSFCKFIRRLHLIHVRGTKSLIITSSSLEEFVILFATGLYHVNLSAKILKLLILYWGFDSSSNKTLQISAPKLKNLFLMGDISDFSSEDCFKHSCTTGIITRNYSDSNIFVTKGLVSLLHGVRNTKVLYLNSICVEVLFKNGCLPRMFLNLAVLNVQLFHGCISIGESLVLALTSLLSGTPNLLHLYVGNKVNLMLFNKKEKVYGKAMRTGKPNNSMVIPNLKSVTIYFFRLGKYENGDFDLP